MNCNFGENITYQPSYEKWVDLFQGKYSNLIISFVDQNIPKKLLDINKLNYKDDIIE
jgi:hypothetical protein